MPVRRTQGGAKAIGRGGGGVHAGLARDNRQGAVTTHWSMQYPNWNCHVLTLQLEGGVRLMLMAQQSCCPLCNDV